MSIPSHPSPRRATCATCLRPQPTCICRWIAPLASQIELLILQHPLEVANAKGSARLLHLCLPGSRLVAGEAFEPAALHALLHEGGRTPLLLYPAGIAAPAFDPAKLATPANWSALRLVVLDGTWRKSLRMLHANPLLQSLPRWSVSTHGPARYAALRRARLPAQLSTLEATCAALADVECAAQRYAPLLDAFDRFVEDRVSRATAPK